MYLVYIIYVYYFIKKKTLFISAKLLSQCIIIFIKYLKTMVYYTVFGCILNFLCCKKNIKQNLNCIVLQFDTVKEITILKPIQLY